jgi:FkbM family methyltransferase
MARLDRLRRRMDEAGYLYGFSHNLRERIGVTSFLFQKMRAQLLEKVGTPRGSESDISIELYGARHVVDLLGSEIYLLDEIYRERLYDRHADFVPGPGSTVVDVGANVGMFAVRQAARGAHVYAFEPNPHCYRRLARAIVENAATSEISLFNYAVGAAPGTATLHVPDHRTALGSLAAVGSGTVTFSSEVNVTCLDQILPALDVGRVDLLKIDAEGAEVDVLRGAAHTLQQTEHIILEYHSDDLRDEVSAVLEENGFRQVLHVDTPAPYLPDAGMIYAQASAPAKSPDPEGKRQTG